MAQSDLVISPVSSKADFNSFIDIAWKLNAGDPNWVPPIRSEVVELLTPGKNPFHDHADMQLFIARQGGAIVGRISAHIDQLALKQPARQGMGPVTGNWGLLEAGDEATTHALIGAAENWLREQGMSRVLAPISLSIWEEPGLLVRGHDHPPTVMMGHDNPAYQAWIESAGYARAKTLLTYELDITREFPPLIQRIIQSGERSARIKIRPVALRQFERDAKIILGILNDAWSENWGFVPFTDTEIAHISTKIKPLVREDLIMIAELEGNPVAFMITLPDANEIISKIKGKLLPFGWARLMMWLRNPQVRTMRVPLMGVLKEHQGSRLASQLAFMMIEYIRRNSIANYGATRGEIGWILDDNQGMNAIAEAIFCEVNKEYWLYDKQI